MKPERIDFILGNLSRSERDALLREILSLKDPGESVDDIIASWEAAAEINSEPRVKNKILRRSRALDQFLMQASHV